MNRASDVPIEQGKLLKCLQIIELLKKGSVSITQIAERFDISTRTVYRYLHLFEAVGFDIDKDFEENYFIADYPVRKRRHQRQP